MNDEIWKILLIEDDEEDYQLTLDLLEQMRARGGQRYRLHWASTYAEGARLAAGPGFDVALVDYDLGAGNGVELIGAAVAGGSPLAFVLLTGQGNYQIDMQAMQAGADDYLNKTESTATLLERAIRYALSHKRSTQSLADANRRLQASEERFQLASRAVVGMLYDYNLAQNSVYRSEGSRDLAGLPPEAIGPLPQDWQALVHPDDLPAALSCFARHMQDGPDVYEVEYRVRHADGRWVHVLDRGYIVRGPDGQVLRVVGTTNDISRQKQLEAELRHSEERFRLALANTPVTVATIDRDLRYTWVYNPRLTSGGDSIIGQTDAAFLPPDSVAALADLKRQVLESGAGLSKEMTLNTYDGPRTMIVALEPMRDHAGQIVGMTAASLDITEQRAMERRQLLTDMQVEAQRHLLDQREMERQQIARDLHDGPVQEVVGLLFALQEARNLNAQPELEDLFEDITQALHKLSNNLRGVCNELRPPLLARFGIERAIRAHAEAFAKRNAGLALDLDLSASLPPLGESVKLALYRIFQESLNNIFKHARASKVTVRLRLARGQVQLEVQDNGVGFNNTDDWAALARDGHLGLVGMRERAQAIGGRLEVFSRPGKGTRIRVTAPAG